MRIALPLALLLSATGCGEQTHISCKDSYEVCLLDAYAASNSLLAMRVYLQCVHAYEECAGEDIPDHYLVITDVEAVATSTAAEWR